MVRNIYFIVFNRYLIWKNTTNYSKSQQTTEAEAGHFLYFDCISKLFIYATERVHKLWIFSERSDMQSGKLWLYFLYIYAVSHHFSLILFVAIY